MSRSFHDRLADLARPPESLTPDLRDMERRATRRRGRKRLGSGVTAALIALAATMFVVRAFDQPTAQMPVGTSSPTVSNGRIAFNRSGLDVSLIETINPDGTSASTLPNTPRYVFHPVWSPDGHRIAFDVQSSGGRMQIFVVNEDGTGMTQLTDDPGWNYLPAWSSDGSRIAFVSTRDGNDEIYVMNADGSAQMRLTQSPNEDLEPSWAPAGDRIAFASNRGGSNQIYVMNADGTAVTQLTDGPRGFNSAPAWSPDGARIAFAGDLDGSGLYTMKPDGTDIVRLTHDWNVGSLEPAWSPDGTSIVYTTSVDVSSDVGLFILNLETGSRQAVPGAFGGVFSPSWQPIAGADQALFAPYVDPEQGFSVEVPAGWTVADQNLTPWLSRPSEILSVGTFPMPVSHDPGDELRVSDGPVAPAALAAMTSTDAFVSLQASGPTDHPDDRPSSFRTLPERDCCSAQTGDYPFAWWWIPFIDQGRAFYLFVAIGNDADTGTSDQAWAIADSLSFDPTP